MTRLILAICAFIACVNAVATAAEPSPLIDQFIGSWSSDGDAFGAPAQSMMVWSPALGGKFTRLDYRIDMRRGEQQSFFEGTAYYRADGEGRWRAFWADSSGDLHPVSAEREGDAIVSHWGVEGAKQGRTRYELLPAGVMQVTDWIKTPEGWRQFNQNTFIKIETVE